MKPATKSFIKKLVVFDVVVLLLMIILSLIFVIPNCSYDCEVRGQMMGAGTGQFIVFTNVVAAIWFNVKSHRKEKEERGQQVKK